MLCKRIEILIQKIGMSKSEFTRRLNVVERTFYYNVQHRRDDKLCWLAYRIIDVFPEISKYWLFFGEGPMLTAQSGAGRPDPLRAALAAPAPAELPSTSPAALPPGALPPQPAPAAVPLLGLASCGMEGWQQIMPYPVSATAPAVTAHMVAVIASGDSMAPAGIASGHICFCDPDQAPIRGDAVYVVKQDGMGAIKQFLGVGAAAGEDVPPDRTRLQGWRPAVGGAQRETFTLDVPTKDIRTLATVIFVKRRL